MWSWLIAYEVNLVINSLQYYCKTLENTTFVADVIILRDRYMQVIVNIYS